MLLRASQASLRISFSAVCCATATLGSFVVCCCAVWFGFDRAAPIGSRCGGFVTRQCALWLWQVGSGRRVRRMSCGALLCLLIVWIVPVVRGWNGELELAVCLGAQCSKAAGVPALPVMWQLCNGCSRVRVPHHRRAESVQGER